MRLFSVSLIVSAVLSLTLLGSVRPAAAEVKPTFGEHDITTLFFISKSDDKNHLEYGMRLDENCTPVGKDAVFPYWRVFEKTPPVPTVPLNSLDYLAYGIAKQHVISTTPTSSSYFLQLKAIKRDLYITTNKGADGKCTAIVHTAMASLDRAELVSAYIKLRRPMSVEYLEMHGINRKTGQPVEERIQH